MFGRFFRKLFGRPEPQSVSWYPNPIAGDVRCSACGYRGRIFLYLPSPNYDHLTCRIHDIVCVNCGKPTCGTPPELAPHPSWAGRSIGDDEGPQ
jgi:hypothetical protein